MIFFVFLNYYYCCMISRAIYEKKIKDMCCFNGEKNTAEGFEPEAIYFLAKSWNEENMIQNVCINKGST